jgi:hypothetical protein
MYWIYQYFPLAVALLWHHVSYRIIQFKESQYVTMSTPTTAETLVTAGNPATWWTPTAAGTPVRAVTSSTAGAPGTVCNLTTAQMYATERQNRPRHKQQQGLQGHKLLGRQLLERSQEHHRSQQQQKS